MRHCKLDVLVKLADICEEPLQLGQGAGEDEEEIVQEPLYQPDREHALPVQRGGLEDELVNDSHEDVSIVGGVCLTHGGAYELLVKLSIELKDVPFGKQLEELDNEVSGHSLVPERHLRET